MIQVINTAELENKYDLSKMNNNRKIRILGGLAGKDKYNEKQYEERTTYTVGQVKQILGIIKIIESNINPQWNQLQRAKFIYNSLGRYIYYNHDESSYDNQQSSNLTGLLSRNSICAGFSLIYKEMMDRQGISCDYVRGIGEIEKHAWNVLRIEGNNIPVDLTWDEIPLKSGRHSIWFGNQFFAQSHFADIDEIPYNYSYFTNDMIRMLDQSISTINPSLRYSKTINTPQVNAMINNENIKKEKSLIKLKNIFRKRNHKNNENDER